MCWERGARKDVPGERIDARKGRSYWKGEAKGGGNSGEGKERGCRVVGHGRRDDEMTVACIEEEKGKGEGKGEGHDVVRRGSGCSLLDCPDFCTHVLYIFFRALFFFCVFWRTHLRVCVLYACLWACLAPLARISLFLVSFFVF